MADVPEIRNVQISESAGSDLVKWYEKYGLTLSDLIENITYQTYQCGEPKKGFVPVVLLCPVTMVLGMIPEAERKGMTVNQLISEYHYRAYQDFISKN
jgi:hypothetical protein